MKKQVQLMALVVGYLFLSGCFGGTTPVQTLLKAPKLPVELEEIKTMLNERFEKEIQYISPARGDDRHSTQFVDLDQDGVDEMIILHKLERDPEPMRITIMYKGANGWAAAEDIKGVGFGIDQIQYPDIDNDGKREILVGWQGGITPKKGLSIYSYDRGRHELYFESSYTEFAIGDFTADETKELIVIQLDINESSARATLYDDVGKRMVFLDEVKMAGVINGYYNIISGLVSQDRMGLLVDTTYGAYVAYTDLLVWRDGQLENVFYDSQWGKNDRTEKAYPIASEDIDQDGVLEIPIPRSPLGYDRVATADKPWITTWYEWDGDNGLDFNAESYTDKRYGFRLKFPARWKQNITVSLDAERADSVTLLFVDAYTEEQIPVLTIAAVDRNAWEANLQGSAVPDYEYLDSTLEKVFVVKRNDLEEHEKIQRLAVTMDELAGLFETNQ